MIRFLKVKWHKLFHKKAKIVSDVSIVDGSFIQYQKCRKCGITITFTVGRIGEDE